MALNSNMLKCIHLMVYSTNNKGEIAEEVGVRRETISAWLKRDDFQEGLEAEMHRKFKSMATKAAKKLDALLDSDNERIVLDASKEILNKAGYNEVQKIEQTVHSIEIEIEDDNA